MRVFIQCFKLLIPSTKRNKNLGHAEYLRLRLSKVCPSTPFGANQLIIRTTFRGALRKKCAPTLHPLYTHAKHVLLHLSIAEQSFGYRRTTV